MITFTVLFALVAFTTAAPSINTRIDLPDNWKVIGGVPAAPGAYPFMVSLRRSANTHFCGGSVINTQWVLTAAHCLVSYSASEVIAVVGTNTLSSGGDSYAASRLIVHESYDGDTVVNDVGVIQLSTAISYSLNVAPVILNTDDIDEASVIAMGWGTTSLNGEKANDLQELSTNTITVTACQSTWGDRVSSNQICAVTKAGEGVCHNDSGGPLILASNKAQVGLVSYGFPCAWGYPDVYTRISSYVDWINNTIET